MPRSSDKSGFHVGDSARLARTNLLQDLYSPSTFRETEPMPAHSPARSTPPTPSTSSETESPLASTSPEPGEFPESSVGGSLGKRKRGRPRTKEVVQGPKRPRGRPRKIVVVADTTPPPAKRRGRPRKVETESKGRVEVRITSGPITIPATGYHLHHPRLHPLAPVFPTVKSRPPVQPSNPQTAMLEGTTASIAERPSNTAEPTFNIATPLESSNQPITVDDEDDNASGDGIGEETGGRDEGDENDDEHEQVGEARPEDSQPRTPRIRKPLPNWLMDDFRACLKTLQRRDVNGQFDLYAKEHTFWFRREGTWFSLQTSNLSPPRLYAPRLFVWDPLALYNQLPCPTCRKALTRHSAMSQPRRCVDLTSTFWIVGFRYRCRHCVHPKSGKRTVTWRSWDSRILAGLPRALAAHFPARLTHRSAVSNELFSWMRSCFQNGMGSKQFADAVLCQHLLAYDQLHLQYLEYLSQGEIRSLSLVPTKAQSQYELALSKIRDSLELYGHPPVQLIFTDNITDRAFLETSFPSLRVGVTPVEKYGHLPAFTLPPGVTTLVRGEESAINVALSTILEHVPIGEDEDEVVVGFDCEWNVEGLGHGMVEQGDIAIVQLAFEDRVYILQISKMVGHSHLPEKLIMLLQNPRVRKAGRAVNSDLKHLEEIVQPATPFTGALDLAVYAKERHVVSNARCSLADLCATVLGKSLRKNVSERFSMDWERAHLTSEQMEYAACDAYAPLAIYRELSKLRVPQPLPQILPQSGADILVYSQDRSSLIASGHLSPLPFPIEYDGIHITPTRALVTITKVLVPGAIITSHHKRPLSTFGCTPFELVCNRTYLRMYDPLTFELPCPPTPMSQSEDEPGGTNEENAGDVVETEEPLGRSDRSGEELESRAGDLLQQALGLSGSMDEDEEELDELSPQAAEPAGGARVVDAGSDAQGRKMSANLKRPSGQTGPILRTRVLKDIFHLFNMLRLPANHGLRKEFMRALRDILFVANLEDRVGTMNSTGKKYRGHYDLWISNRIQERQAYLEGVLSGPLSIPSTSNGDLYIPTKERLGILTIPDNIRLEAGIAEHAPDIAIHAPRRDFEYLARIQNTRKAVLPVHTTEEYELFDDLMKSSSAFNSRSRGPVWKLAVRVWNERADMSPKIFYKLIEHLKTHYALWNTNVGIRSTLSMSSSIRQGVTREARDPHRSETIPHLSERPLQPDVVTSGLDIPRPPQPSSSSSSGPTINSDTSLINVHPNASSLSYSQAAHQQHALDDAALHPQQSLALTSTPPPSHHPPPAAPSPIAVPFSGGAQPSRTLSHHQAAREIAKQRVANDLAQSRPEPPAPKAKGSRGQRTCQKCGKPECPGKRQVKYCYNLCQDCGEVVCYGRNSKRPTKPCSQAWSGVSGDRLPELPTIPPPINRRHTT
ncbi:hypothetical protein D9611_008386 [Ephemerocybe angulata]|uniref:3'-5' exonuclease n=1 Tax=Ephemerocybe angulata TaxID=980116 RepID=A0A8H5F4Z2_9AGAR|nr:hypothetical protein D9611_008386 [Tulosesus angulatus]